MADFIQRLQDPTNTVSPRELAELQEKIAKCMTRLFKEPKNGGNPFLYALAMSKPHFLLNEINGQPFETAATDGRAFYWHGPFLKKLDADQTSTVMSHECFHVTFFHPERMRDKDPDLANIAMDYIVNAVIEKDHQDTGRHAAYRLWGGALGEPLDFATYLGYIDGKNELPKGPMIFVDVKLFDRSPESVYDEIMAHWEKSPRKCKKCKALSLDPKTGKSKIPQPWQPGSCPACGALPKDNGCGKSLDTHLPSKADRQEVMADVMKAAQQAKAMRGTVPAAIEDALKELEEPTLQLHQIIKHCMFRKALDVGTQNDWSRFRRRYLSMDPAIYIPKKKSYTPRWLAMIDTSGSMSERDMANGLKELKLVANGAEGWVVPNDAQVYWDKKTKIENARDLSHTKIHGRGGTVFDQFFRELPKEMPGPWDVIIIITDGDCGTIDPKLHPGCDILWVITNKREFKPTFGRVVQLNPAKH